MTWTPANVGTPQADEPPMHAFGIAAGSIYSGSGCSTENMFFRDSNGPPIGDEFYYQCVSAGSCAIKDCLKTGISYPNGAVSDASYPITRHGAGSAITCDAGFVANGTPRANCSNGSYSNSGSCDPAPAALCATGTITGPWVATLRGWPHDFSDTIGPTNFPATSVEGTQFTLTVNWTNDPDDYTPCAMDDSCPPPTSGTDTVTVECQSGTWTSVAVTSGGTSYEFSCTGNEDLQSEVDNLTGPEAIIWYDCPSHQDPCAVNGETRSESCSEECLDAGQPCTGTYTGSQMETCTCTSIS